MRKITEYFSKLSKPLLIVFGFVLTVLVGVLEYLLGPEIAPAVFYVPPLFMVVWFTSSRWYGILMSIFSAISWGLSNFMAGAIYSHLSIFWFDVSARLAVFFIITVILVALKNSIELASIDTLTRVKNRRAFLGFANMEINRSRRFKHIFSVAYFDIDNFKSVNDCFGHSTGDILLRLVANTMASNIRIMDVVARIGGDEFIVLLPETGFEGAQLAISRLKKKLLLLIEKNAWPITLSVGVATFFKVPSTVDEIMRISDKLMYDAKKSGKNTIKHEVFK